MSSRTPQRARRVLRDAGPCAALAVLLAVLVACLGYVPAHGRTAPAAPATAAPVFTVSVAHERLGSPAEHDRCCGLPTREARAVLPVGAHPLPAVAPRMPVAPHPAPAAPVRMPPPAHGAPDLHILQVQRI
ncbi:hypothetical protein [Streptomyces apricus]|uniref:Uncharacterized protein n=1 Tax=Streptomyces apricus TaxID=1828112 RepID=A0A5B0BLJ1_9ACTN|nr:hypothetical protein [Streptomyces apricus]KAA0941789.1 hypothetical protein FGF04_05010 [Streptomyces apricus]